MSFTPYKSRYIRKGKLSQAGFTIVELMIASLVFSMVLLLITYGVISFTNSYYKGINRSTTQNTTRNAIDTITQAIQFAGNEPQSSGASHCAGNYEFAYTLGQKPTASTRGIFAIPTSNCGSPSAAEIAAGQELLEPNMLLSKFSMNQVGTNLWTVELRIVHAPDLNMLCSPSVINSCADNTTLNNFAVSDLRCRPGKGSEFCAVSELKTTVLRRINTAN